MRKQFRRWSTRRWTRVLVLVWVILIATQGGTAIAQDYTIAGEWEITFEVVSGNVKATWIGRVWENDNGDEQLVAQRRVDISQDCQSFGNPTFSSDAVTFDGVDDYITCKIPDFRAIFATMSPQLANCRCRFDGPPYASADISPVLTTAPQPVVYHNRLHLEVMQRDNVADLELAQSISNNLADLGSTVGISITVTNHGPSKATGVMVEDKLPSGYTYVSDDSGGRYDSDTGLWSVGIVADGQAKTLQLTATVNDSGDYVNLAQVVASNELDPDSTPDNLPLVEDDDDMLGINPSQSRVRFPWIMTGAGALQAAGVHVAANDIYGQAQLTLHFNGGEVQSWQSNVFSSPKQDGFQLWGGYNATRYVEINSQEGFAKFLSSNGFWDEVAAGDYVDGFYMWESQANTKYLDEKMPSGFGLSAGTDIYIGYNPSTDDYFEGTMRAVAVDPGCRGH